jgi:hypothetical protein
VDASLKREIDARLTSVASAAWDEALRRAERARENPYNGTTDYGLDADGNHTMSTAEHERVGYEILHPSARIWRDEKTLAVSAFSLWQPEVFGGAQIAHGIATHSGDEVIGGLGSVLLGRLAKAEASVDSTPTSEPAPTVENAGNKDYRATFFSAHPELEGQVIVHHAIEQQVLTKFPGVVSEVAIHALENLRGIPLEINSDLHLSTIRVEWNRFYKPFNASGTSPTLSQLVMKATEIDLKYGHLFLPPVGAP